MDEIKAAKATLIFGLCGAMLEIAASIVPSKALLYGSLVFFGLAFLLIFAMLWHLFWSD